ncbi:MAG: DNA mismatch repair protein MutS [Pseudopedobacter saltans]|uniref:DNA mismatch repair protein MutS n=1 Tax=Pseudopedobacter saltans TaxID=151895 RepID=A0A2W5H020_9SPHI|nr:MAG: DNA mismatch repair protein MutS [Pseudopedobacter saltans]
MQIDQQTLNDLGIFNRIEENSIFHLLNFTVTSYGREQLQLLLAKPMPSIEQINERQKVIRYFTELIPIWTRRITNGTLLLIDRFYHTRIAPISYPSNAVTIAAYRLLNANSFGAVRYSAKQFIDFLKGIAEIRELLDNENDYPTIRSSLLVLKKMLEKPHFQIYQKKHITVADELNIGYFMQKSKGEIQNALQAFGVLEAWMSLAIACQKHDFVLPTFTERKEPYLKAEKLYHPLLQNPKPYDIQLDQESNFLFLTGANMAGKSTFIKAVGLSVYLAHLGIGVPAKQMELCYFDGLFSNIQITDNILQGESYFFNEVKRIKDTVERISDGKKWLVLIDELFKGTNVRDAMRCSVAVIEGFRKVKHSLFLLSTHLYEIENDIKHYPNILFRYFETHDTDGQLSFSYQLKEGVSNDRIGYLILQREGVIEELGRL